jgi:anti-sigma B factor antagonist
MVFVEIVRQNWREKNKRKEMKYFIEIKDEVLLLNLEGDLIGDNNEAQLIEELSNHLYDNMLHCAVDISKIRFINSSGISILIAILTRFRNKGGEVVLVKPSEQLKKLLIITKLNSIFTVVEDREAAINQLKNNLVK